MIFKKKLLAFFFESNALETHRSHRQTVSGTTSALNIPSMNENQHQWYYGPVGSGKLRQAMDENPGALVANLSHF